MTKKTVQKFRESLIWKRPKQIGISYLYTFALLKRDCNIQFNLTLNPSLFRPPAHLSLPIFPGKHQTLQPRLSSHSMGGCVIESNRKLLWPAFLIVELSHQTPVTKLNHYQKNTDYYQGYTVTPFLFLIGNKFWQIQNFIFFLSLPYL